VFWLHTCDLSQHKCGCVIILTSAVQLKLAFCSAEDWVKVRNWAWCHNISSYSLQHTAKNYKIKLLLIIWAKHYSLIWRDPCASWLTFWQNILLSPSLAGSYEEVLTTYQTTNCRNFWRRKQMFLRNYGYYTPNYTVS